MSNLAQSKNKYISKLVIVTDACCIIENAHKQNRAGKGKAACGVIYLSEEKELSEKVGETGKYLGEMTVPEAEYNGLILALDNASNHCRNSIEVWLDSELIVKHMTGAYRLKAENLKPLFDKVKSLETRYKSVEYFHHNRSNSLAQEADELAHKYLRKVQ